MSGGLMAFPSVLKSMAQPVVFRDLPPVVKMVDRRGPGLRIDHVHME